jgi:23S rRNA A2030 N6-methylase RlmJ
MPRGSKPSTDSKSSTNKKRVRFVFEPDRESPNGITFSWLIHQAYHGKEKAATATRSFWLPFAYRETGEHSEEELRELAQQSIWRMEEQIQHLRESFGLESPIRQVMNAPVPQESLVPTETSTKETLPEIESIESLPAISTGVVEDDILDDFADDL